MSRNETITRSAQQEGKSLGVSVALVGHGGPLIRRHDVSDGSVCRRSPRAFRRIQHASTWSRPSRTLYSRLFPTLATIRADAFEEEREWRLFSSGHENFPVDVRAGKRGLVPYKQIAVNVPWELSREDRLSHPTIVELVVGPGPDQAEQVVLLGKC